MCEGPWWGVEETLGDLFAHLGCVLDYDGNLHDALCVTLIPGDMECDLSETPALIGLHGASYTVVFHPGERFRHCVPCGVCCDVCATEFLFCGRYKLSCSS